MKFYIKNMFRYFTIIYLCASIGAASFITIIFKDAVLRVEILWQLLGISFIASLISCFLLESKKEISKNALIIRMIIHCILIYLLIVGSGVIFNWIDLNNTTQIVSFSIMILLIYVSVWIINYISDNKTANELNERIKYYKDEN